jgi:hypothetical protein
MDSDGFHVTTPFLIQVTKANLSSPSYTLTANLGDNDDTIWEVDGVFLEHHAGADSNGPTLRQQGPAYFIRQVSIHQGLHGFERHHHFHGDTQLSARLVQSKRYGYNYSGIRFILARNCLYPLSFANPLPITSSGMQETAQIQDRRSWFK